MSDTKKQPNPIDVHAGSRLRARRTMLGLSQEKLGEHLGITFQQIQKYEKGVNRMGASRLQQVSDVLGVPVSYFFEDLPDAARALAPELRETGASYVVDAPPSGESMQLNRAFVRIQDPKVRKRIIDLVRSLAEAEGEAPAP